MEACRLVTRHRSLCASCVHRAGLVMARQLQPWPLLASVGEDVPPGPRAPPRQARAQGRQLRVALPTRVADPRRPALRRLNLARVRA